MILTFIITTAVSSTASNASTTAAEATTPEISNAPLFEAGRVTVLPSVMQQILCRYDEDPDTVLRGFLIRHLGGDWAGMGAEDQQTNQYAARNGVRVLSAFPLAAFESEKETGITPPSLWIITEADRSVTTFLMPDDY